MLASCLMTMKCGRLVRPNSELKVSEQGNGERAVCATRIFNGGHMCFLGDVLEDGWPSTRRAACGVKEPQQ